MINFKTLLLPAVFTLITVPSLGIADTAPAGVPAANRIALVNTGQAGYYTSAGGEVWFFRGDGLFVRYLFGRVAQAGRWVLSADGTQVLIQVPGAPPAIYNLETLEGVLEAMKIALLNVENSPAGNAAAVLKILQERFSAFYHS